MKSKIKIIYNFVCFLSKIILYEISILYIWVEFCILRDYNEAESQVL